MNDTIHNVLNATFFVIPDVKANTGGLTEGAK